MEERERLLPVARGEQPADLLLTDARVANVFSGEITRANVAICAGRIAAVGDYTEGRQVVSLGGACLAPGLIDAHVHIESTMLPPPEFARAVLPRGTTSVIADPHEIANVLGVAGIRFMLDASRDLPLRVFVMLPSCVPATNMETAGAALSADDLAPLMDDPRVAGLGEMMNFPGAIHGDPGVMAKLRLGHRKRIDGHAPGVTGRALQAYAATGISTDHEATTIEEAREKLRAGMRVLIREGSAARNLDALLPLVTPANAHRFCFCTDDRHPEDLVEEGHIDHVLRRAIAAGLDPVRAIQMATLFTARHFGQNDLGAIAPGYRADMIVFDDPADLRVRATYFGGRLIARDGKMLDVRAPMGTAAPKQTVRLPADLSERSFAMPAIPSAAFVRVIELTDRQLTTGAGKESPRTLADHWIADPMRDLLKLAVIERHRGAGNIGLGFVRGFGLKHGALASTVAHDSHNLLVVGTNDADMLAAARAVADAGGGQAAARDGKALAVLPLPIAGLMSDQPVETVVRQQAALREAAASLGSRLRDPFMPLSFLSLPVIPKLKLTDRGLVDVDRFDFVPLALAAGESP